MNHWVSIFGTALSLLGITIAIYQILKTRKAAEAALLAANMATDAIQLNVTLTDVSSCINEVEEIKVMIRSKRYEAALLRVTDLSGRLIQLKNMPMNRFVKHVPNSKEMLAQLSVLRDLLERKLQNEKLPINASKINKILSEISDGLNIWIGSNKYLPGGKKS